MLQLLFQRSRLDWPHQCEGIISLRSDQLNYQEIRNLSR